MRGSGNLFQRMADSMDLAGEPIPGQPLIEIAGDSRVLIENHFGVKEYTREQICVMVKFGLVKICGCGLELSRMTREQLVVSGQIHSVSLQRRGK